MSPEQKLRRAKRLKDEVDGFNPNDLGDTWATFIPERKPKWKLYDNRGHAIASFTYQDFAILFKAVNGEWVEVTRREFGVGEFLRDSRGKVADPPTIVVE